MQGTCSESCVMSNDALPEMHARPANRRGPAAIKIALPFWTGMKDAFSDHLLVHSNCSVCPSLVGLNTVNYLLLHFKRDMLLCTSLRWAIIPSCCRQHLITLFDSAPTAHAVSQPLSCFQGVCTICKRHEPHNILACPQISSGERDCLLRGLVECAYCYGVQYDDVHHWCEPLLLKT